RPSAPVHFLASPEPPPTIYTLSLHDALPISATAARKRCLRNLPRHLPMLTLCSSSISMPPASSQFQGSPPRCWRGESANTEASRDRKSTRLNSSHVKISYAVFCLKKKTTSN